MSFSSAHNDYLDPDRFLGFANDEFGSICEDIRAELRKQNGKRWDREQIDCTITGKNADLEPWGHQGVEVVRCDDDGVHCKAHIYKFFAGYGVCLNFQPEIENDDEAWEKAREAYLDQANEIVAGCAVAGEWDESDWVMDDSVDFTIPWETDDDDDEPDVARIAQTITTVAQDELIPLEQELTMADEFLEMLAGWKTISDSDSGKLVRCPEGKPGPEAAWMQAAEDQRGLCAPSRGEQHGQSNPNPLRVFSLHPGRLAQCHHHC